MNKCYLVIETASGIEFKPMPKEKAVRRARALRIQGKRARVITAKRLQVGLNWLAITGKVNL